MTQLVKNLPANAEDTRDLRLNPGSGRSPGERNGNPLQSGKFHGEWSLAGYSPWGHKESKILSTHAHTHT